MHSLTIVLLSAPLTLVGCARTQPPAKPTTAVYRANTNQGESGPHFTRAQELYKLGPTKGAEIIAELDLELRDHPDNLKALVLKATTQMGIEQLDAALATLDRHDEVAAKTSTLSPSSILLRARCLFYKGDYEAAQKKLDPFWALFQSDPNSKSRYDSLMAAIAAKLQKPSDK